MSPAALLRYAAALTAGFLVAHLAVATAAQPTPTRVVQAVDGTLFLVQGDSSWVLVPDQISDEELAVLAPAGEIDGTIPDGLLTAPDLASDLAPPPGAGDTAPPVNQEAMPPAADEQVVGAPTPAATATTSAPASKARPPLVPTATSVPGSGAPSPTPGGARR